MTNEEMDDNLKSMITDLYVRFIKKPKVKEEVEKEVEIWKREAYLREQYVIEDRTQEEIAEEHDVSAGIIGYYVRKFGLKHKKDSNLRNRNNNKKDFHKKEWLEHQLYDIKKSIEEIAQEQGVTDQTIIIHCRKNNIDIRNRNIDRFIEKYCILSLNSSIASKEFVYSINNYLREHNFKKINQNVTSYHLTRFYNSIIKSKMSKRLYGICLNSEGIEKYCNKSYKLEANSIYSRAILSETYTAGEISHGKACKLSSCNINIAQLKSIAQKHNSERESSDPYINILKAKKILKNIENLLFKTGKFNSILPSAKIGLAIYFTSNMTQELITKIVDCSNVSLRSVKKIIESENIKIYWVYKWISLYRWLSRYKPEKSKYRPHPRNRGTEEKRPQELEHDFLLLKLQKEEYKQKLLEIDSQLEKLSQLNNLKQEVEN